MKLMVQLQIINKILKSKSVEIVLNHDLTEAYFQEHSDKFNFIMDHYRQYGKVPDISTFLDKFNEFDFFDVEESDDYLIDKITEEYQYSRFVPVLNKVGELMQTDSIAAIDYLRTKLQEFNEVGIDVGVDIISNAHIRYEEYKKKRDSETPWMLPTGFKEFDEATGGLCPGEEFVVIVARTNNGKSWLLTKILEHLHRMGIDVGLISPEMSASQIGYRFDTLRSHFSNFELFTGRNVSDNGVTYEEHIEQLENNAKHMFKVATPIEFNNNITVSKLRAFCLKNNLGCLGIDGISYLSDERYRRGDNKTTSLTNISQDLMSLSCELHIPILAVVQANRNGVDDNGGNPQIESIRDSDGIAHNATKVISVRQRNNKMTMELIKARNCKVGIKLSYDWDIDHGEFTYTETDVDDDYNSSDNIESRNKRQSSAPVENKQPLVRRQGSNEMPF